MGRFRSVLKRLDRGSLPHFSRILVQQLREVLSTRLAYLSAHWWQVSIGKGCSFVGQPNFRKTPHSSISIGRNCRFLSLSSSNLHGLNRSCRVSTVTPSADIKIGNHVGMSGTVLVSAQSIQIGDRVFLGANTTVSDTNSHSLDFRDRMTSDPGQREVDWREPVEAAEIVIEDDVFIGMHSIILKGVTIGRGAVVGAGSVVSQDLPAFCIAAGNPAKPVNWLKNRFPDIERN